MGMTNDEIARLAEKVSKEKLELYTQLLRKTLMNFGVEGTLFDDAAQAAALELEIQERTRGITKNSLLSYENRGIDTVGRLVVEYCFIRSPQGKMIWPEYSDEDTMARWQFHDTIIPRPLMRYFLISVRGTIEGIDNFSTQSFLFENNTDEIDSLQKQISDLIEEFKGPFGSGESSVDWQEVYEDARFKNLTLTIIANLRSKMSQTGLDFYLKHLNEYHQIDPQNEELNLMQRPFTLEDAQQLESALSTAEETLTNQEE